MADVETDKMFISRNGKVGIMGYDEDKLEKLIVNYGGNYRKIDYPPTVPIRCKFGYCYYDINEIFKSFGGFDIVKFLKECEYYMAECLPLIIVNKKYNILLVIAPSLDK